MARTVNIAFNEFAKAIEPNDNEKKQIMDRHEKIRGEIGDFIKLDKRLPHFLTGSYKRKTLIHPANDVDVMLVLDREAYWDKFNDAPRKLLEFMKRQLKKIYGQTEMRIQTHSIGLLFRNGPTVDIVPGFMINEEKRIFQIPNKEFEEYIKTSPDQHQELISEHNKKYSNFIKIVKMIKIWKKKLKQSSMNQLKLKSFHIEILAMKSINKNTNYRDGVILFFEQAESLIKEKLMDPINLSGDISSYLDRNQKEELSEIIGIINKKIKNLIELEDDEGKHQDAISGWRGIFGHPFPKRVENIKNQGYSGTSTEFPEKGDPYTFGL